MFCFIFIERVVVLVWLEDESERNVQRAGDVMRFERKPQDFQYGKTSLSLSLAFLAFCMGSFEVRVTILTVTGDSYQRTLT